MNSRTKQHRQWHKELKEYLMGNLGIEWCESCGVPDVIDGNSGG